VAGAPEATREREGERERERAAGSGRPLSWRRPSLLGSIEALLLLVSPALAYAILRLAVMSQVGLPDPSIHTAYVVDPRQMFARYAQALSATARMREGARVGFVVPARISYLLLGAVPGFVVFRYVLALVAVVPSYLLLKRLYGRPAGATAVILILSCPVMVRAWGTDYPNSAGVSYVLAGIACLGLALIAGRGRVWWVALAGALAALAVWAFFTTAVVIGLAGVTYLIIQAVRARKGLLADLAALVLSAGAVTLGLVVLSGLLIGQFNYISPTWRAYKFLSEPSQETLWHSRNWHWLTYDTYLLVLPAVIGVGAVAFVAAHRRGGRGAGRGAVPLFLIVSTTASVLLAGWLQFDHGTQMLEVHFWSSLLWPCALLTLAVAIAELSPAIEGDPLSRWLPPAAVLAVPLIYEAHGSVPAMRWMPDGIAIALVVLVAAGVARLISVIWRGRANAATMLGTVACVLAIAGGLLVITVAPPVTHVPIRKTVSDPLPEYAATLGVSDALEIDQYRIVTRLPNFTGAPAYQGEQLFIWWPHSQFGQMIEPMGIYHAGFDSIPGPWGMLSQGAYDKIEARRPGQVLLLSYSGWGFRSCLAALSPFDPRLVKRGVLSAGPLHLHVWLIDLELIIRHHRS
jgi:hypothetical protein